MKHLPTTPTLSARASVVALALLALVACGSDPEAATPSSSDTIATEVVPTPTPEPTPVEPQIVAYAGGESAGYLVQGPADARKMSDAPAVFRDFIGSEAARIVAGAGCDSPDVGANVEFVSPAGWAIGSVNECGGYRAIWGTVDGEWEQVLGTQDSLDCAVLVSYRIPSDVVGETCYDYQAGKQLDYEQE